VALQQQACTRIANAGDALQRPPSQLTPEANRRVSGGPSPLVSSCPNAVKSTPQARLFGSMITARSAHRDASGTVFGAFFESC